jgi:hypothetical protein
MALDETQFYDLYVKFTASEILEKLPDDVEEFCKIHDITVDYFIQEWL